MKGEVRLQRAVEEAVAAADRVILDASDGSVEETNYLTAEVARRFAEKLCIALEHARMVRDLLKGDT